MDAAIHRTESQKLLTQKHALAQIQEGLLPSPSLSVSQAHDR